MHNSALIANNTVSKPEESIWYYTRREDIRSRVELNRKLNIAGIRFKLHVKS